MPDRYRRAYDVAAAAEHAAIVARRAGSPAHVEIWRQGQNGEVVLCVVADDRPGLLSLITASLAADHLDVVSAQVYTRRHPKGSGEAVDLLSIRRDAELAIPIGDGDVARIGGVLRQLVAGEITLDEIARRARPTRAVPPGASTNVAFEEDKDGGLTLTVETFDRPGLLLAISAALYRADIQIIASDAVTRSGRVLDRFTIVEGDGSPIRPNRRGIVQIEVLDAIHGLSRGAR